MQSGITTYWTEDIEWDNDGTVITLYMCIDEEVSPIPFIMSADISPAALIGLSKWVARAHPSWGATYHARCILALTEHYSTRINAMVRRCKSK